ncbi:MAG: M14 family zinc carboxypeptidase [Chitinophagales bacterium]
MKGSILFLLSLLFSPAFSQAPITPFEKSEGKETATYPECINFYKKLDQASNKISIRVMGKSDAGYPYHVILFSNDGRFNPAQWHAQHKLVILVINGIHPGEPDGVDASMMLIRDLNTGKIRMPENIALAIIPIYNVGGALNRNSYSRVNQNGPASYGFRGNSQNLDLNRDFTKSDSRDSRSFAEIFHWLDPDIQLDNHVSDGADYQYTMTLISSQWNKLGGELGRYSHDSFDPLLYRAMEKRGWPMCPYVNVEDEDPGKGWREFYDPPRYSSGFAALFHTLGFIAETHMLKPFTDRVLSTYVLMQCLIESASAKASDILERRKKDILSDEHRSAFDLKWEPDNQRADTIFFRGYTADRKPSEITGRPRLFYDHNRPFERRVPYYDYFTSTQSIEAPDEYIIPQGWHEVVDLLKLNGVSVEQMKKDIMLKVQAYHIDEYHSLSTPYEKHHKNFNTKVSTSLQNIKFQKGDFVIPTNQPNKRFLVEMLEPIADDSYFSWNFFDAILQQKEGYSDYRWEDIAANWLHQHPELKSALDEKIKSDSSFANNPNAQLAFIYKRSPYYEPAHLRYPVYRLLISH